MQLAGPGFVLRAWRSGDEDDLVRFGDDRAVWRNLADRFPHPYTLEAARIWVRVANQAPQDNRNWAIEVDGAAVGAVGFERKGDLRQRSAEIGYWLGAPFWGRGLATAALRMATDVAFASFDFVRLQAGIIAWNHASCRVAEKAGYVFEGRMKNAIFKDGEVADELIYARCPPG